MKNEIILRECITMSNITEDMVDRCCKVVLDEARELDYQESQCYQIAAVYLWLITHNYEEKLEILKILGLKED